MRVGERGAASVRVITTARGAAALLAAGALVSCGVRTTSPAAGTFTPAKPGVLTVATSDIPSPGFWQGTRRHLTGGFEYGLARSLAERFGLRSLQVRLVHFHRVVAGNLAGADLGLDLITPTSEREQHLDFSTPYLTDPPTVLVRRNTSIPDLATAQGLRWGAVRATTFVGDIREQVDPEVPIKVFDDRPPMIAALRDGGIDAVMLDLPLAVATANHSGGSLVAAAQLPTPEPIAAALPEGSDNQQAVSSAIRAFIADGTVHRLLDRWVGSAAANADTSIPLLHTTLH